MLSPNRRYNIKPVIFTDRDLDQETTDPFIKSAQENSKQYRKAATIEPVQKSNKQYSTVTDIKPIQENNKQYSTVQRTRVEDGIEEKKESRKGKSGNSL